MNLVMTTKESSTDGILFLFHNVVGNKVVCHSKFENF